MVDRIYYGGRKYHVTFPFHTSLWKRNKTYYKEWNGSRWVTERRVNAPSWLNTGTPGLIYYNVNNDVTLEGGALVKQRLKYRYYIPAPNEFGEWVFNVIVEWNGSYHSHYLE